LKLINSRFSSSLERTYFCHIIWKYNTRTNEIIFKKKSQLLLFLHFIIFEIGDTRRHKDSLVSHNFDKTKGTCDVRRTTSRYDGRCNELRTGDRDFRQHSRPFRSHFLGIKTFIMLECGSEKGISPVDGRA